MNDQEKNTQIDEVVSSTLVGLQEMYEQLKNKINVKIKEVTTEQNNEKVASLKQELLNKFK